MLVTIAIVLFIIAAMFGLVILTAILRDRPTPKPFVIIHGPLAATAIVLFIFSNATFSIILSVKCGRLGTSFGVTAQPYAISARAEVSGQYEANYPQLWIKTLLKDRSYRKYSVETLKNLVM